MFSQILGGPIDPMGGAVALAIGFICICVFASVYLGTRKGKRELDQRHELAKIAEHNKHQLQERQAEFNHEAEMAKLGYRKEVELEQTRAGLLTSHRVAGAEEG